MNKNKLIHEYFDTTWNEEDFFEAYCVAHGVDRWDMSEEEETEMMETVRERINVQMLGRLRGSITEMINEMLVYAMG